MPESREFLTLEDILSAAPGPVDGALVICAAMLLDALIGDPPWLYRYLPHPVAVLGRLIALLDGKLNRPNRSRINRTVRGALVMLVVTGLATAVGWGLHQGLVQMPHGWLVEALVVSVLLAGRGLFDHVRQVARALDRDGLAEGRRMLSRIVSRKTDNLDRHGVARASIETLSENYSDALVAPVFWYLLLGLPGICACKAINTLDSMVGYRTEHHEAFGFASARADDAMNYLPARLSGLLVVLAAALTPGARPLAAFRIMIKFARRHKSPNAGWPEAAFAGALNIAIGGPRRYPDGSEVGIWIGEGRARLHTRDIRRAQFLYSVAAVLLWLAAAGLALSALG